MKKFYFRILKYLHVLRSHKLIYAIFMMIYVCMCVCVYVEPKRCIRLRSNFVCVLHVTIRLSLLILENVGIKGLCQWGLTFFAVYAILWEFCLLVFWRYIIEKWRFFNSVFCISLFKLSASYLHLRFFEKINLNITFWGGNSKL